MSGGGVKAVAVVGIALVMASGVKHHGHGILATLDSAPSAGSPAGCRKLERLWDQAGGNPASAQMAAAIAMAESGGDPGSTDADGNGTVDRGYWQINSIWGGMSTYDPLGNARAAVQISHDGTNWNPWVTYQHGAEVGRC